MQRLTAPDLAVPAAPCEGYSEAASIISAPGEVQADSQLNSRSWDMPVTDGRTQEAGISGDQAEILPVWQMGGYES